MTAPLPFDRIRLFELLKPKLGAEESKAIVDALDSVSANVKSEIEVGVSGAATTLATKGDVFLLKDDFSHFRDELKGDIHRLEVKMNERFTSMLVRLVATIFAATGIILAAIKLFFV